MLTRTSTTLSDGSRIADLVRPETREVELRVLSDGEIYELEMERVFGKTWLLLGHASEIPNPGDFVMRDMGNDSVIVARDRAGDIHVSLNVCPHRGMRVCLSDRGNTHIHKCVYHGWAFKPNGDFIGSPIAEEKMHGELTPKSELGLRKARVHLYAGLIFATWNHEGPSFDEFLGEMKWYYDMIFQRTAGGWEVLGPPQRFMVDANWKAAGEQSAADGFHTLTLHRWLDEMFGNGGSELTSTMYGVEVGSDHGHALRCQSLSKKFARAKDFDGGTMSVEERWNILPAPGCRPEMLDEVRQNLTPEQMEQLMTNPPQVGGIFPNVLLACIYAPQPDGRILGSMALHTYIPRGPDKLEFVNWVFAEKGTPEEDKQTMLRNTIFMLGTSGLVEQDDSDTWPHMTASARGAQGRKMTMKYQAINKLPPPANWRGPAKAYDGFTKDDTQWNWWMYWRELMSVPA
jgi:nitrite reductase/ring-hydroxylating ferredoxin subunit